MQPTTRPDAPRHARGRWPGAVLGLLLPAALLAINVLAIWSVVDARRGARAAALADLELQTQIHARSLEALLANLRADLLFLSQSPPIAQLPSAVDQDDPMVRRWLRLDAEGTLLLFFEANPAVERVVLRRVVPADAGEEDAKEENDVILVAGRMDGAPQILPPGPMPAPRVLPAPALLGGSWAVGPPGTARLEAWIEPRALLALAAPGLEDRLALRRDPPGLDDTGGALRVATPVRDDQWRPEVDWWLTRREEGGQVIRSFEELSGRVRTTLWLNVGVVLLSLGLGLVAFRQARRAGRLEAENEQQAQIRELERKVMHNERLASVGRMAAGIAHEINNPLEGMSNFLGVLEDDLRQGDAESAAQWTPKLRHGLDRAAQVVRQVLDFSDPGRAPKERVDLVRVLDETVDFVASNPAFREVDIRWQRPEREAPVLGHRTALGQLVLNLLLNACEVELESRLDTGSHGGGPIEIELQWKSSANGGATAVVTVADHGPGFDAETLEHLFEPFYSGRGSSGLGLAVCHGIVQDLGGSLAASNRADTGPGAATRGAAKNGAVLRVELPLLPAAPRPTTDAAETNDAQATMSTRR